MRDKRTRNSVVNSFDARYIQTDDMMKAKTVNRMWYGGGSWIELVKNSTIDINTPTASTIGQMGMAPRAKWIDQSNPASRGLSVR